MALLKPLRALRYDSAAAGPLDDLVAPPYDVITPETRARLLAASPDNAVRLIRPDAPAAAAETLRDWRERGVLVREAEQAVWHLHETFAGPDGVERDRCGLAARVRLEPYSAGKVLPHERTFPAPKLARLRLLRAVRTKLSPIFLLHEGRPLPPPEGEPDLQATYEGATSRLWRIRDPGSIAAAIGTVAGRLIIADGHHRYETALRFHEEDGTEETGYVLAVLVSRLDPGLTIFPTHRLVSGSVPELNGRFRVAPVDAGQAIERLAGVPRDHPAFVLLRREGALLAEVEATPGPLGALDTAVLDKLGLEGVTFTSSAEEAAGAVSAGRASAALLVRPPTIEQIEAVALAGETMPPKSTYFFPKLLSGLLFSPFDE
jgi:uncharacterized protein (DUF1015 family)